MRRIAALVACAAVLAACNEQSGSTAPPPAVGQWSIQYSPGMPPTPTPTGSGWSFDFPGPGGSVHYVVAGASGAARVEVRATVSVTVDGAPFFDWHTAANNTCDSPSTARLYFQRRGDDITDATGAHEFYRWWSSPVAFVLAPAQATTIAAPVAPDQWLSVFGKKGDANAQAAAGFQQAAGDVQAVGLTFGGGCFYGHGVFVTGGSARFNLSGFSVR